MLRIEIPEQELFDDLTQEFRYTKSGVLELEHSLLSLSKWESKFEKPFLDTEQTKTDDEFRYYIECMSLTPLEDPRILYNLSTENVNDINEYINSKQSATWFSDATGKSQTSKEIITSEIIYYWLVALQIPFDVETWHLKRLLTLIRVINTKNQPSKKMSRAEAARRSREINARRLKEFNTSG